MTTTAPRVAPKPTSHPNGPMTTEKDPNAMEVDPLAVPAGPKCYNCNKYRHLSQNCTEPRPVARIQKAGGEGDALAKILELLTGIAKKEDKPVVP